MFSFFTEFFDYTSELLQYLFVYLEETLSPMPLLGFDDRSDPKYDPQRLKCTILSAEEMA